MKGAMRYFVPLFFLIACNSPKPKTEQPLDSVSVVVDTTTIQNDGLESSLYTIEDQVRQMTFPLYGKTYDAVELFAVVYWPDQLGEVTIGNDETPSAYIVTDAEEISGNFFSSDKSCSTRTVLHAKRMEIDAEYHDLIFLEQEADGSPKVADKVSFDGSQGQSDTQLDVVTEGIGSDKTCYALKITSSTEGGDIDLHRDEWVEYFIADAQAFHSVLKIVLEETEVQDYEVSQDENKNSTSETRSYEFLSSSSNGLYDVIIHTVVKRDGIIDSKSDQTLRFDGQQYK